jgi:hypothetical protein
MTIQGCAEPAYGQAVNRRYSTVHESETPDDGRRESDRDRQTGVRFQHLSAKPASVAWVFWFKRVA